MEEVPSKGPPVEHSFSRQNLFVGGISLIGGTGSPAPLLAAVADSNGNWQKGLKETHPPSPPLPIFHSFSQIISISAAKLLRNWGGGTQIF